MKRLLTVLFLLMITTAPAAGQNEKQPPLLDMLALVPSPLPDSSGWATVQYVDYEALYTSEGIDEDLRGDVDILLETVPLPSMMSRIAAAPDAFNYLLQTNDQMPEVVGFNWLSDVNRSLDYGAPPHTALILQGIFDDAAIGAALRARDFEQTDVNGIPVWHRFDDAAINPDAVDPADPFGGILGMAARIAILPPDYLANSRYWEMTEAVINTAQGMQDSLADNATYRAAAEAITAPDGLLLQALFFNPADVGYLPLDMPGGDTAAQGYNLLLPYTLAVLADRQEGQDQVHLVGVVYPDVSAAETAVEELAARIRTFSPQPGRILVEEFEAEVSTSVYESGEQAVALVEVRYPLPENRIDAETGNFISGGRLYRLWVRSLMERGFTPLLIVGE